MSLASYLKQIKDAISQENGKRLGDLFQLDSEGLSVVMQASRGAPQPFEQAVRTLGQPWGGIVVGYLQALSSHAKGEKVQACQEFRERHVKPLVQQVQDNVWVLPAAVTAARTLRVLSGLVDDDTHRKGTGVNSTSQLQQCAMVLQGLFGKAANAKGADADLKRAAALAVGCIMLKIYFRLNTLSNCKNVTAIIDDVMFNAGSKAQQVTYRYFTGRLKAYDEDFVTADLHLSFALHNCPPEAAANKRRILRYLVPIKMLLGVLPAESLLRQYKLTEYIDMAAAVQSGDVALLTRSLDTHQVSLVQAGTYLLLEKLQLATYRRLFKKCALVHAANNPAKATQVPLALFAAALELQGIVKDDAELQCLLANLIYRKYIKGYIAFKARVVVLAKTDAFPSLATVQLGDPFS